MLTAACYEHRSIIGKAPERIANFEQGLLNALQSVVCEIHAHVILPNHYHCLVCLLYTSPSPRDGATSRMPSSA